LNHTGRSPQPPLLCLGCLLAGGGFGYAHPLATGLSQALRWGVAASLLMLVATLGGWGLWTFKREGTTPEPNGVASALLTTGPFRLSRNPLYLALSTTPLWVGFLLDSAWMLLLTPVLVLLLDRLVIAREEVRLRAQFGDDYLAYTQRVRRWF